MPKGSVVSTASAALWGWRRLARRPTSLTWFPIITNRRAFWRLPILAVVPLSLNSGTFLVFPENGLSLRWYRVIAESPQWAHAFGNSFKIAVATTLIATQLGTLAAIGDRQSK